jgi:hypothetical protein
MEDFGADKIRIAPHNPLIVELEFLDVRKFLDVLSPTSELFARYDGLDLRPFIFRGMASASWPLVPSILRAGESPFDGYAYAGNDDLDDSFGQLIWEQHLLRSFFEVSDRCGLRIPGDSQSLRALVGALGTIEYVERFLEGAEAWPPDELVTLMTVAQHYGLPTRLLDWTWNPLTAALFAAAEVPARGFNPDDRIVVCALNLEALQICAPKSITLITAPPGDNPRLVAQEGLFTLYRPAKIDVEQPARGVSLDEYIRRELSEARRSPQHPDGWVPDLDLFYRFLLPAGHAPEVVKLLARSGVHSARLFPGFDGVVRFMRDTHFSSMSRQYANIFGHLRERR